VAVAEDRLAAERDPDQEEEIGDEQLAPENRPDDGVLRPQDEFEEESESEEAAADPGLDRARTRPDTAVRVDPIGARSLARCVGDCVAGAPDGSDDLALLGGRRIVSDGHRAGRRLSLV